MELSVSDLSCQVSWDVLWDPLLVQRCLGVDPGLTGGSVSGSAASLDLQVSFWCSLGLGCLQVSCVEVYYVPWSVGNHLICLLPSLHRQGQGEAQYWTKVFWPWELLWSLERVP